MRSGRVCVTIGVMKPCKHATESTPICLKCARLRAAQERYNKTPKAKARRIKYARSDKGRAYNQKAMRKRQGMSYTHLVPIFLAEQGGRCGICRTDDWGRAGPCADHDHKTGKVRGVLCRRCNLGIGNLQDSVELLRAALTYLLSRQS